MIKVLQMLLRSPGGKKAAAALYRSMNKGKKAIMGGRGRRPAGNVDVLKMYERAVREGITDALKEPRW